MDASNVQTSFKCSEKTRANAKRYRNSAAGKAYIKEYRNKLRTPEGKKKRSEQARKYYKSETGQKYKRTSRLAAYGMTPDKYEEMLIEQAFCCAICNSEVWMERHGKLTVDHDHETGAVRGLLCYRCNVGLGMFLDAPSRLLSAIAYLEKTDG